MLVIFWNVQRPGETGFAPIRLDAVLADLNTLVNTYTPDFICLKTPFYQLSGHQTAVLALSNLQEIPTAPDGDCLFASLLAMGVQASDGTAFHTVQALRDYVANAIRNTPVLRRRLLMAGMNAFTIATQVATPRFWFGDAGDLMPELIAVTLGIRLIIINPVGGATKVGAAGTQYALIRFNPQGSEHYHGTRPNA